MTGIYLLADSSRSCTLPRLTSITCLKRLEVLGCMTTITIGPVQRASITVLGTCTSTMATSKRNSTRTNPTVFGSYAILNNVFCVTGLSPHCYSGVLSYNKRNNNPVVINDFGLKYLMNYLDNTLKMSIFVIDK